MRVRVLHVLEAIEGGTSRHVVNVVRHVDAEHLVVVPPERVGRVTDTAAFGAMAAAGAKVELIDMRRSPSSPHTLAAVPRVHRLIRQARPNVVHGHSSVGGAVGRLATVGTAAARVYTPNGVHPARGAQLMERALGRLTDRLIASSPSEAALVQRLRLVPCDRIVVIPNAVELDLPARATVDLRARLGVDPRTPLVGTVARLVPQKAPEMFVRACRKVADGAPDVRFVLAGDGPLAEQVIAEVAAAGLQNNLLLLRDCPDGETLMSQLDIFVLSSRYEAGATYVVMEAMRVGTPVIVTDVVGNCDAVEPGRSGLVVPPEDPEALAEAIKQLLRDPTLRRQMGDAGRTRLEERFDVRVAGAALTDLYRSLA